MMGGVGPQVLEGQDVVSKNVRPQDLTLEQWYYLSHRWWTLDKQSGSPSPL